MAVAPHEVAHDSGRGSGGAEADGGTPIVVQLSVELLVLEAMPPVPEGEEDDWAFVLLIKALGEVRQSGPLQARAGTDKGGAVPLSGRFSFQATFDGSWKPRTLRRLLDVETLRMELLRVPLADPAAWERRALGAERVAAYSLSPWPWLLHRAGAAAGVSDDLCARASGIITTRPHPSEAALAAAPWLRLHLRSIVAREVGGADTMCQMLLPGGGDVVEVPRQVVP